MKGDSLQQQTFPPSEIATQASEYQNQPIVALPAPLTNVQPAWASCIMGDTGIGLFDPPRAILPAVAMAGPEASTTQAPVVQVPALAQDTVQPASGISSNQPAKTSVVVQLPNGETVVDFPPVGASIQASSQTARASSAGAASIIRRPLPFNPDAASSPISSGTSGGNARNQGEAVVAGSNGSANEKETPGEKSDLDLPQRSGSNFDAILATSAPMNDKANSNDNLIPHGQQSSDEVSAEQQPAVTIRGNQIKAAPSGGVAVNGATVNAATPVNTANGVQVSLGGSGVVVGGNKVSAPSLVAGQAEASVSLNGHTVQVSAGSSGNQIAVDGQAIPAGSSQALVGGNAVRVLSNGQLSVLPTTLPYLPISRAASPATTSAPISNQAFSPQLLANGAVSIAGTILSAGGSGMTMSGTPISVLPKNAGVIIGQNTIQPISTPPPRLGLAIGGQILTPVGNGRVAVDGITLSEPRQRLTLQNGEIASLKNGALVVGTQTLAIPSAEQQKDAFPTSSLVIGGQPFTPVGNGAFAVQGVTLSASGQSIILQDGEVASLQDGALIVGTYTISLPTSVHASSYQTNGVVVNGQTLTPVGSAGIAISGTTLSESGQSATLPNGEAASLKDGALVVGTQTLTIPRSAQMTGYWAKEAVTGGNLETLSDGNIAYDGVTLSRSGPAVTLSDGEVVSLRASASASTGDGFDMETTEAQTTTVGGGGLPNPSRTDKENSAVSRLSMEESGCALFALTIAAVMIVG